MQGAQYPRRMDALNELPALNPFTPVVWRSRSIWLGRWLAGARVVLPVLVLFVLFVVTGLRGVDYGFHWDEAGWHTGPVRQMVATGTFLPRSYIYPSFDKWLVLLPSLPAALYAALDTGGQPVAIQAAMLAKMDAAQYLLHVRGVFIVVSALGIFWTYGAALALRHRTWEALVAASGLGLSWEYAYHSRWAATDCILVQFSALTLFMLAVFQRTGKSQWLYAAALAAGLGTGTKYTGVFLLAPALCAGALSMPFGNVAAQIRRAAIICGLAFAIYLVTTPATFLDPFLFLTETRSISTYYMHRHGSYTAGSALQHGLIVLSYFGLVYFSPYTGLATLMFAAVLAGGVLWIKRDLRWAVVLVGFPLLFLVMFCARYRVVIIRNYLFVAPWLALLCARGIADFAALLRRRWLRRGFAIALLAGFLLQAGWLVAAGESIRHIDPGADARQALAYVRDHRAIEFRVSNQIRDLARSQGLDLPANVVRRPKGSQVVFFGDAEGPGAWNWKVNDPWLTKAVFGPREVNFNWYSSWSGHDHVVVMDLDKAKATGVPLAH